MLHPFPEDDYVAQSMVCVDFINSRFSCSKHTNMMTCQDPSRKKEGTNPLKKADGPSLVSIVVAQLGTLVYCPGGELTNVVFTMSTGEDRTVAQNLAMTADTKWQGTSSANSWFFTRASFIRSWVTSSVQLMMTFLVRLRVVPFQRPVQPSVVAVIL